MTRILPIILLVTLLGNLAYADTNAVILEKGDQAPYKGVLLTPEAAADQRTIGKQRDSYKLLDQSLETSLTAVTKERDDAKQEVHLLSVDNVNLTTNLKSVQHMSDLEKLGYVVLGIAITCLAIEGADKLHH